MAEEKADYAAFLKWKAGKSKRDEAAKGRGFAATESNCLKKAEERCKAKAIRRQIIASDPKFKRQSSSWNTYVALNAQDAIESLAKACGVQKKEVDGELKYVADEKCASTVIPELRDGGAKSIYAARARVSFNKKTGKQKVSYAWNFLALCAVRAKKSNDIKGPKPMTQEQRANKERRDALNAKVKERLMALRS